MSSRTRPILALSILLSLPISQAQIVMFGESGIVIIDNTQLIATGDSLSICDLPQGKTGISGMASLEAAYVLDPTQDAPTSGSRSLGMTSLDPYSYSELEVVTVPNSSGSISIVGNPGQASEHVYLSGDITEPVAVTAVTGLTWVPDFASHVAQLSNLTLAGGSSSFFSGVVADVGASPSGSFCLFLCIETGQWAVAYDAVQLAFDSINSRSVDALAQGSMTSTAYGEVIALASDAEVGYFDVSDPESGGADAADALDDLQVALVALLGDDEITDELLAARLDADAQRVLDALTTNANYPVALTLGGLL